MLIISGILTEQLLTVSEYCWIPWFCLLKLHENASSCGNCQLSLYFFCIFFFSGDILSFQTDSLVALTPDYCLFCYRGLIHVSVRAPGAGNTQEIVFLPCEGYTVELS